MQNKFTDCTSSFYSANNFTPLIEAQQARNKDVYHSLAITPDFYTPKAPSNSFYAYFLEFELQLLGVYLVVAGLSKAYNSDPPIYGCSL